jgi:DNA modification methylase
MLAKVTKKSDLGDYFSEEFKVYFYMRGKNGQLVPVNSQLKNLRAKEKLNVIREKYWDKIPSSFCDKWEEVKLFETSGDLNNAHSIILDLNAGSYDLNNKLNHLTGKEWTKFTCSWFIFNALPSDLKEERELSAGLENHPATYSPTMISDFIRFFTKEGMSVLDPFLGIGTTLEACKRVNRIGYGMEVNPKYFEIAKKRIPQFSQNIFNSDSRTVKKFYKPNSFDFCISSPPYWDILNRSTDKFEDSRSRKGLDVKYSDSFLDLGNIDKYEDFLDTLSGIYFDIYDLMKFGSYTVIIVKNVKKEKKVYPLAWDLAKKLSTKYELKDEKIWIQDKVGLSPYAYPYSWASNILHHYCLIFRKE